MSRTALSRRSVGAVLALTVSAASLVGLGQAAAAPPATFGVTGVSPAYVEADVDDAFGVTLTGKGFTRDTRVTFGSCTGAVTVPPTTVSATKLVVKPPRCAAGPVDITATKGAVSSVLKARLTFLTAPVVATVAPAVGPWNGGTTATVTVREDLPAKAAVQVLLTTDGVTKPVAGKVDAASARQVSFKVPAGVPGGKPTVAVSVFGIASAPVPDLFTYRSTIKTAPAVWVKDAVAPAVKIDGAGFSKGAATVTICGVDAPLAAGKVPTDKSIVVTPPAWSAVAVAGVDAARGGVCTVQVAVAGGETSVVTAGSTFTYAVH